jgi:signal transduction histidine kinase
MSTAPAAPPEIRRTPISDLVARVRSVAAGDTAIAAPNGLAKAEARLAALASHGFETSRDRADTALLYAADAVAEMAIEASGPGIDGIDTLLATVVEVTGLSTDAAAVSIYMRASSSPRFHALAPRVAAKGHLRLLTALAPITDASVWVEDLGSVQCIAAVGSAAETRRFRNTAASTIAGHDALFADETRAQITGVAVERWGERVGAIVARTRPENRVRASVFLLECRAMFAPVLERDVLLDRSTFREQQLHLASERRLRRIGFDLHDGPLQDVAALAADLRLTRDQLSGALEGQLRTILLGRFDDLTGRLEELDRTLREFSHSLEASGAGANPVEDTLRRELEGFDRRSGINGRLEIRGSFDDLSPSQRIAIFRIVQEGLANVREHSGATHVTVALGRVADGVRLVVADDGAGFDVPQTVVASARRGRLGLVGMSERVRLLGGAFSLSSAPGEGTEIRVSLPEWRPAMTEVAV